MRSYHFQRLAPLTLLANLAAAPAVGLVVMPMALATVILMPFGLEVLPLTIMGYGIDWMDWVAAETAAWSEGLGGIRAAPLAALLLVVGGFLWLALWRERWRLAGLVPIAAMRCCSQFAPRPDILVADGRAAAAPAAPTAAPDHRRQGPASRVENWLRADGDPRDGRDTTSATASPAMRPCAWMQGGVRSGCRGRRREAPCLEEDCRAASGRGHPLPRCAAAGAIGPRPS